MLHSTNTTNYLFGQKQLFSSLIIKKDCSVGLNENKDTFVLQYRRLALAPLS